MVQVLPDTVTEVGLEALGSRAWIVPVTLSE
ncbi:Uncharacterised protein [uncultured Flavonifractor sp.]|nr:Uncharacterised protein [uncultured Clostridium sp.]SCI72804.1 Uncharacterised protein [uncultured Flavonifractor sp.]